MYPVAILLSPVLLLSGLALMHRGIVVAPHARDANACIATGMACLGLLALAVIAAILLGDPAAGVDAAKVWQGALSWTAIIAAFHGCRLGWYLLKVRRTRADACR